ncbi:hypothetical protein NA57DRAFT_54537 [Rhizodiscina lignyota]|uniref:DNA-directed RNA polymerase II subunit RPB9-like zinc ribbon domain-containing protein n=1 Tax=Rhizodiscina lignyota TaxID=1504668 RepID=A0A9P4MC95_9PEZI|nr:hypothetical protein NA57DRAFT_54537 [Rhizodiscina lignyota]
MSASPAPSDAAVEQPKKITFRFCRECSNLLYPKENRDTNELRFECRTCRWDEVAPSSCVYRNQMSNAVGATAGITQDIGQDPTVGIPVHETSSHLSQLELLDPAASPMAESAATSSELARSPSPPSRVPDVCTMCGELIFCEKCGEAPTDYGCFLEVEDEDIEMGEAQTTDDYVASTLGYAHLDYGEDAHLDYGEDDNYDDCDEEEEMVEAESTDQPNDKPTA